MSPANLISAITALANAFACRCTAEELALLSAIFVQLGDTLATIVTVQETAK